MSSPLQTYEYRVIPAPSKGKKASGLKTAHARFAYAVQELINEVAAEGWSYERSETLPSIERSGLTGSTTNFRSLLVFRRPATGAEVAPTPLAMIEDQSEPDLIEDTPEPTEEVDVESKP